MSIDRLTLTSFAMYVQCYRRHVVGIHCAKYYRLNMSYSNSAMPANCWTRNYKIAQKHTPSINNLYKTSRNDYAFIPTTWRRYAVTIDRHLWKK